MPNLVRFLPAAAAVLLFVTLAWTVPVDWLEPSLLQLGEDVDETLMYVVDRDEPLRLRVPAGTDVVVLHVVSVVDLDRPYRPSRRYPLALNARLEARGRPVEWSVFLESRVSLEGPPRSMRGAAAGSGGRTVQPIRSDAPVRRGTFLAERDAFGTDNRVVALPVRRQVSRRGGVLTLRASGASDGPLLVRAFGRRPTGRSAQGLRVAPGPEPVEDGVFSGVGSALGGSDLPLPALAARTERVMTRLEALGERGEDYRLERVVLTDYRRDPEIERKSSKPPAIEIGPRRYAALSFEGPVRLAFRGAPGARFRVAEGLDEDSRPLEPGRVVVLDESGRGSLRVYDGPPRALVFFAPTGSVRVSVAALADRVLGRPRRVPVRATEGTTDLDFDWLTSDDVLTWLVPEVRHATYAALDPRRPVTYAVEPDQERARLVLRKALAPAEHSLGTDVPIRARVELVGGEGLLATISIEETVPPSVFERFESGSPSSKGEVEEVELVDGTTRIRLYGPPDTFARLYAMEPAVEEKILRAPYRELEPPYSFRYALYDLWPWASLRPVERDALDAAGRLHRLEMQTRVVWDPEEPESEPRRRRRRWHAPHARVLSAKGAPLRQRVLMSQKGEEPFPPYSWTDLDGGREVRIDPGTQPSITVFAQAGSVGQRVRVRVDGQVVATPRLVTSAQRLDVRLPQGRHRIALDGLSGGARAYIDAPPVQGPILRRRSVEQLSVERPLEYTFEAGARERQHLLLQIVSERPERRWMIGTNSIAVSTESGETLLSSVRQRAGMALRGRRVRFRDRRDVQQVGWSAFRIRFPRLAEPTRRVVTLLLARSQAEPLWVRAVLMAESEAPAERELRVVRRDEP